MNAIAATILVLFVCIVLPLYIVLHFVTKWKETREISRDDEQLLEDLWQLSQRFEDRLETLEKILDDDLPGWRRQR